MAPQVSWGIIIPILHRFHERRVTIPEIYYEAKITIILKSGKARLEYICVYLYLLCICVYRMYIIYNRYSLILFLSIIYFMFI